MSNAEKDAAISRLLDQVVQKRCYEMLMKDYGLLYKESKKPGASPEIFQRLEQAWQRIHDIALLVSENKSIPSTLDFAKKNSGG